jgi:hypothetical protein
MGPKRIAVLLATAGVAAMSLIAGTAQAAVASNCNITGPDGAHGQYICGTQTQPITWVAYPTGFPLGRETVVVGTDYRVYHDYGQGWKVLNGGAVLPTAPPAEMGVFKFGGFSPDGGSYSLGIRVLGTTGHYFCTQSTGPNHWSAWTTSGCAQN